jgi:hypothetical protein
MSLEDPFFVVRDEVRQSLTSAQQQYSQWSMLLDSDVDPEKVQSVGSELKNLIKSIEWDLEDLDQTIKIAEANPAKFRLNYGELESRKQFIRDTRAVVKKIKDYMNSDAARSRMETLKRKVSFIAVCCIMVYQQLLLCCLCILSGLGCALVSTGHNSVGKRPASSFHLYKCVPVLTILYIH